MPKLSLIAAKNTVRSFATRTCVYGVIDTPVESSRINGDIVIAGWAFSKAAPVTLVEAWIDEEPPVTLPYGNERADVAAAHPWRKLIHCGYCGTIRVTSFVAGPRSLTVRVTDARGNRQEYTRSIVLAPMTIHLDSPAAGASCGGLLKLSGWAYSPTAKQITIHASLDGQTLGELSCDVVRPDVAAHARRNGVVPETERYGFWRMLSFTPERVGPQTLVVQAVDEDGNSTVTTLPLRIAAPDEPVAEIDHAEWRDGILAVTGWAIWAEASTSARVRIYLDDTFAGETPLNLSRPDIRRSFPDNPAAIRCGFHFRQFSLPPETNNRTRQPVELLVEFTGTNGRVLQRKCHVIHESSSPMPTGSTGIYQRLHTFIDEYKYRFGHALALLDWNTGLNLTKTLPDATVITVPPVNTTLPYIDHSIEVIAVASTEPEILDEARRVAIQAILQICPDDLRVDWLSNASEHEPSHAGVSIIIPVYNQIEATLACLHRLEQTIPCNARYEIIVVDDGSTAATYDVLQNWACLDERRCVIRNGQNLGFLLSCNRGAEAATGEMLIFLNNDTLPQAGWLPALLQTFRDYPDAGAVGCKLVYPDGTLQEAGGLVFADGSAWNFGRHDPQIDAPLYSYVREVDYCSGACLATPRALFDELGGFDPRYAPAYYEDTDYCFRVREHGYRVYYQPAGVIIHAEGTTAGRDPHNGVKRHQLTNQATFFERWRHVLKSHPQNPHVMTEANRLHLVVREQDTTA